MTTNDPMAEFVEQAQLALMARYMRSSPVINLRGWRYIDKQENVVRGHVPLKKTQIKWLQYLIEQEHRAS